MYGIFTDIYHKKSTKFSRWWFQVFFIFTPNLGEMIQFDAHIFQMDWFNHQLFLHVGKYASPMDRMGMVFRGRSDDPYIYICAIYTWIQGADHETMTAIGIAATFGCLGISVPHGMPPEL